MDRLAPSLDWAYELLKSLKIFQKMTLIKRVGISAGPDKCLAQFLHRQVKVADGVGKK